MERNPSDEDPKPLISVLVCESASANLYLRSLKRWRVCGDGRDLIDGTWVRVYGQSWAAARWARSGARLQWLNESWVHYDDEEQTPQMDYDLTLPNRADGSAEPDERQESHSDERERRESRMEQKWGLRQLP